MFGPKRKMQRTRDKPICAKCAQNGCAFNVIVQSVIKSLDNLHLHASSIVNDSRTRWMVKNWIDFTVVAIKTQPYVLC